MIISIDKSKLLNYTLTQVKTIFPDGRNYVLQDVLKSFERAIERLEYCFSKINNKYFIVNDQVSFNHLNGDQYSMFLYFFSNSLYINNYNITLCEKLFLLNKTFFGIDAFYEIKLPDIFLFVHPVGTVLGRASYSDFFLVYQRCNIGANHNIYPVLEEHVSLHPGSSVLGNCRLEWNTKLGANALLIDKNLPSNNIYIGNPKAFEIYKNMEINPVWKI